MYFVSPYLTQNTESLYKDYSALFLETLAAFCEKETQQSNCLLEEILIYLLMPFCSDGSFRCATGTVVSCPLLGRLHRAYYSEVCMGPTTWTVTPSLLLAWLHGSY